MSDGTNLVKFRGKTFLPANKALEILGRISEKIWGTSFQISCPLSEASFSRSAVLIIPCKFSILASGCIWYFLGGAFKTSRKKGIQGSTQRIRNFASLPKEVFFA